MRHPSLRCIKILAYCLRSTLISSPNSGTTISCLPFSSHLRTFLPQPAQPPGTEVASSFVNSPQPPSVSAEVSRSVGVEGKVKTKSSRKGKISAWNAFCSSKRPELASSYPQVCLLLLLIASSHLITHAGFVRTGDEETW